MKKLGLCLGLLFSLNVSGQQQKYVADTLSPVQIVQLYVSPNGFPGKMKFFCCELYQEWYADKTLGQQLPANVQRDVKVIYEDTIHAAVSVWLHDSVTSKDIYFYLVHNQTWAVYAARSLAYTDVAVNQLKKMDSIPLADRGKTYTDAHGRTFAFEHDNLTLWGGSDTNLVQFFRQNEKTFNAVQKRMTKKGYYGRNDTLVNGAMKDKKIKSLSQKILIRGFQSDKLYPGAVFYMLGGVSDNSVGYMYQPDATKVPNMTEKHFILVRPLGNGWYLFKTT
ncbi:MAG TPA: hypothetical protein VFU15_11455 [Bacteroidia bacterium]|nr:hypothetical protein [Bacteroidia bacterium]